MEKRIAAFCNMSLGFVEQIRKNLQSQNVEIVTVSRGSDHFEIYLNRLADRLLEVVRKYGRRPDNSLYVLVISGSTVQSERDAEQRTFFPATRFMRIDRSIELSQPQGRNFVENVAQAFLDWKNSNFKEMIRPGKNSIALLPLKNVNSAKLRSNLLRMWQFESAEINPSISKDISIQKGDRGILANGLEFRGCLNTLGHPVRRCTDSAPCDLKAELRLGHPVSVHFEFDVTSTGRLSSRKFFLCDGEADSVDASASHLNMRINDDFKPGYK